MANFTDLSKRYDEAAHKIRSAPPGEDTRELRAQKQRLSAAMLNEDRPRAKNHFSGGARDAGRKALAEQAKRDEERAKREAAQMAQGQGKARNG